MVGIVTSIGATGAGIAAGAAEEAACVVEVGTDTVEASGGNSIPSLNACNTSPFVILPSTNKGPKICRRCCPWGACCLFLQESR